MGRLEDYYYGTLLLMRGAPASGKSQWVRDNNLGAYTLENRSFPYAITQPFPWWKRLVYFTRRDNGPAWGLLLDCLEKRMSNGDFVVF